MQFFFKCFNDCFIQCENTILGKDHIIQFLLYYVSSGLKMFEKNFKLFFYHTYIRLFHVPKGLFSEICNKTTIKYNKINSM